MKTLIKAEKFMREAFMSDEAECIAACQLFVWHYKMIDMTDHTNHAQAIYLLYKCKNKKLTKQRIADELFTTVKSLKKDRENYEACFSYIYQHVLEKRITEESAITLLK